MSNFSPRISPDLHLKRARTKLSLTKLSLAGEGTWPDLHFEALAPQLNVFYGPPSSGKSSLAHLIGHLLYGKSESPWRRQFGQTVATTAGALHLEGSIGKIVLRRHRDGKGHEDGRPWRLTIASEQGEAVDSQTLRTLLSDHSMQIAPKLLLVDFAESPRVDWLLREHGAREFPSSLAVEERPPGQCASGSCASGQFPATDSSSIDRVDRRRVDELIQQRDAIASTIEQQLSVQRRESEVLLRELGEVDSALESKREQAQVLQAQLHRLAAELADFETRLRYFSLEYSSTLR